MIFEPGSKARSMEVVAASEFKHAIADPEVLVADGAGLALQRRPFIDVCGKRECYRAYGVYVLFIAEALLLYSALPAPYPRTYQQASPGNSWSPCFKHT